MATILAVDDTASLRQMVCVTLQNSGHEVVQAADGEAGLSAARSTHFDLVITDVHMPRLDGITLVERLRGLPAYRATPLLIMSSESSDHATEQGKAAGATGWLRKPFAPETLLDMVQQVLI